MPQELADSSRPAVRYSSLIQLIGRCTETISQGQHGQRNTGQASTQQNPPPEAVNEQQGKIVKTTLVSPTKTACMKAALVPIPTARKSWARNRTRH